MTRFYHFLLYIGIALILMAACPVAAESPEQQRNWFTEAEKWVYHPQSDTFLELYARLEGYPLRPYLQQRAYMADLSLGLRNEIETFLDRHEDTPLDAPLREKWLRYLAKRDQREAFRSVYRDLGDTELQCHFLHFAAEETATLTPAWYQKVTSLWLHGESQPEACDPVFRRWRQEGHRTTEMIYQRLVLAADGGDHTLIPYLRSLLPESHHYLADLWHRTRRDPSYVTQLSRFSGSYPDKEKAILAYGYGRLIWRRPDVALRSWDTAKDRFNFTTEQTNAVSRNFALALAVDDHPKAEFWLEHANRAQNDPDVFRWHLTHVLRQQDWQHVVNVIGTASQDMEQDYASRYWLGRSLANLDDRESADEKFTDLSQVRHYYGFMASGQLATEPNYANAPLIVSEQQVAFIASMPEAQRAKEWLALERFANARREWWSLQDKLTREQALTAAILADRWGWHDQVIFAFSRLGYFDDVNRRFPLAFQDTLTTSAEKHGVDPAWAFAIARRESSFMRDANSGAGARGLMQLLPSTARYLAQRRVTGTELYDPVLNADFGTRYLRYLLDKMSDNPILATAAYNAGWGRVKQWLPEDDTPIDVWIETIPYQETRNYVKAVLAYQQIYKDRLGQRKNLFRDVAEMTIQRDQNPM